MVLFIKTIVEGFNHPLVKVFYKLIQRSIELFIVSFIKLP